MKSAVQASILIIFLSFLFSADNVALGQLLITVAPGGPIGLPSDIIFEAPALVPTAGGAGSALVASDAIDGFSQEKNDTQFLLCFSVDAASVGGPPPVPGFPPFNVTVEAANGQAAGDAFISTAAYDRTGVVPLPVPLSLGPLNNILVINQSPAFLPDFGLLPLADPTVVLPPGASLDDVVGGGSPPPPTGVVDLFFTLDAASASLTGGVAPYLSGSGADVFFDPSADIIGVPMPGDEFIYASAATLGLTTDDEIDALVVFDDGPAGTATTWAGGDQILFSLAPGSPSLGILGLSPADILSVTFGGVPGLFASATDLGLGPGINNVNMLELVPLVDTAQQTIENKLVPEPCTLTLLALVGVTFASRRRDSVR